MLFDALLKYVMNIVHINTSNHHQICKRKIQACHKTYIYKQQLFQFFRKSFDVSNRFEFFGQMLPDARLHDQRGLNAEFSIVLLCFISLSACVWI
jgi:hypothetical protein